MSTVRLLLFACLMLLIGCSPLATYDYGPAASFTGLQRYALLAPDETRTLDDSRVEQAVRNVLSSRYEATDAAQADFLVSYRFAEERSFNDSGFSVGLGTVVGSRGRIGVSTRPAVREEISDVLLLDVLDAQNRNVVWSARANRTLSRTASPEHRDELINELVTEMLANFPPA